MYKIYGDYDMVLEKPLQLSGPLNILYQIVLQLLRDEKITCDEHKENKQRLTLGCKTLLDQKQPKSLIQIITSFIPCYWREFNQAKIIYNQIITTEGYTGIGWYYYSNQLYWPINKAVELTLEDTILEWLCKYVLNPGGCTIIDQTLHAFGNHCIEYSMVIKNQKVDIKHEFTYNYDGNAWAIPEHLRHRHPCVFHFQEEAKCNTKHA